MNEQVRELRTFEAKPAILEEVPLLVGLIGPPGGGKTWSALRLATGMKRVRPGPIVLIDTERGRASKYWKDFEFLRVDFTPPFRSYDFLKAVKDQLALKPCAIIIDTMSDEHEGEGGYLDWHAEEVPKSGGNDWGAWKRPAQARNTMIGGFLQIKTPLIFTFRAREKTKQVDRKVISIGYQPIAPLQIVHTLDLTCILPPRAEGVPVWKSDKIGEDFIIKLPEYLKPYVRERQQLSEEMGHAFAAWAYGKPIDAAGVVAKATAPTVDDDDMLTAGRAAATNGMEALKQWWSTVPKPAQKRLKPALDGELKTAAAEADKASEGADTEF